MAWIESHQELGDHPKTRKLATMLGVHRMQAVGHLHALWWWALDYAEDGDLSNFDPFDIALGARWDGDADLFVRALAGCGPRGSSGFLDEADDGFVIHDWAEHTGMLSAAREKARRANHTRWHVNRGARVDGCDYCAEESSSSPRAIPEDSSRSPKLVLGESTQHNTTQHNVFAANGHDKGNKRGTRLPDDFVVSADMSEWAERDLPGLDWNEQTKRFCDYWRAAPGQRGVKLDWPATWRNWMRRAYENHPAKPQKVVYT